MNTTFLRCLVAVASAAVLAACPAPAPSGDAAGSGSGAGATTAPSEASAAAPAAEASAPAAAEEAAPAADGSAAAAAPAAGGALAPNPGQPVAAAEATMMHGTWRVDMMAAIEANGSGMSAEERAMMTALMGSMQITFTFNADGTAAMSASGMGQEETKSGTWAVGAVNGTALTFTLTENNEDGTPGEAETFTATFVDTNNITLSKEGEAETMPLVRQN